MKRLQDVEYYAKKEKLVFQPNGLKELYKQESKK